ncbi:apses-domain-containing protein [Anaeromyces robustus]|uniref:Apses-domain-containing protein n=1 Tax=Anaeromyces robustus TaxID=1754192 RepID=A0A1Y1XM63_9FUNG|nr:apses-domain-containing protein [Anaeromyces robustus]|eukprot:ORX86839.1 apses-domain-containing protein [Anaeromyces robustus]
MTNKKAILNKNATTIYTSTYSGVPVYEMMCGNVSVMRRRSDSFLNATQILKVAGIDKGKRTKILEKEVLNGEHEKVQGGYGKYQGTWIPFPRGVALAKEYDVDGSIKPLLDFEPTNVRSIKAPPKEQSTRNNSSNGNNIHKKVHTTRRKRGSVASNSNTSNYSNDNSTVTSPNSTPNINNTNTNNITSIQEESNNDNTTNAINKVIIKKSKLKNINSNSNMNIDVYNQVPGKVSEKKEKIRASLMEMFLNDDQTAIPDILTTAKLSADDVNMSIDDQGHTALHWAATLARINIIKLLIEKGADVKSKNICGETALIRSVISTHNYDYKIFPELLNLLENTIIYVDYRGRTLLHHIAYISSKKDRIQASYYYLKVLLDKMNKNESNYNVIIDFKDQNGDTALNILSRIGNKPMIDLLINFGADPEIENNAGISPLYYGVKALKKDLSSIDSSNVISYI